MSLLRDYSRQEWESFEHDPWNECPSCNGMGYLRPIGVANDRSESRELHGNICPECQGARNARMMALIARPSEGAPVRAGQHYIDCFNQKKVVAQIEGDNLVNTMGKTCSLQSSKLIRCENCYHPSSEGVWEGSDTHLNNTDYAHLRADTTGLAQLRGAPSYDVAHYSPCDEECGHGGMGRARYSSENSWKAVDMSAGSIQESARDLVKSGNITEALWRGVDARRLSWEHDLRLEQLSILCLCCYAEKKKAASSSRKGHKNHLPSMFNL